MKRLTLVFILTLAISIPCSALTLFQTDYDGDSYTTETVYEGDWLPLRELSAILPYEVEWKDRTIYVYAERTWKIKPDWWIPEGVKIVDGVTYVTPRYMKRFLPEGQSFIHQGELYVFQGETERSRLVRGSETFRANVLTTMYRLKLALPEDYQLIRNSLTGGIEQTEWNKTVPEKTMAYIYPERSKPTAHIIANPRWADLTELIAHEAYHVHLTRQGQDNEEKAREYGKSISAKLLELA